MTEEFEGSPKKAVSRKGRASLSNVFDKVLKHNEQLRYSF